MLDACCIGSGSAIKKTLQASEQQRVDVRLTGAATLATPRVKLPSSTAQPRVLTFSTSAQYSANVGGSPSAAP